MIEYKDFNNLSALQLENIKKLWNDEVGFIYPISDKVFLHHTLNSKYLAKNLSFIAILDNKVIGVIIVKNYIGEEISSYIGRSWISLFYVSKYFRNRGIGSCLLEKSLSILKENNQNECFIGQDIGNYFPGIPCDFDNLTEKFLEKRGFISFGYTHDLILKDRSKIKKSLDNRYEYRFLDKNNLNERKELLNFMEKNFPGRWQYELVEYYKNETKFDNYYLTFDKEKVIGFVRINEANNENISYNITWSNRFNNLVGIGPLGIDKDYRKNGISKEMINSLLYEKIKKIDCDVLIDWTSLMTYYQQFGFEVWKSYLKMKIKL